MYLLPLALIGNWLEQCIHNQKVRGSNPTGGTRHMSREKSINASFISDIDETVQLSFTLYKYGEHSAY